MQKIWFMIAMIFTVSTIVRALWKATIEDKELGLKERFLIGMFAGLFSFSIHIPILYWSYMWLWNSGD